MTFGVRWLLIEENIWWNIIFDENKTLMEEDYWWKIKFEEKQTLIKIWWKMTFDGRGPSIKNDI